MGEEPGAAQIAASYAETADAMDVSTDAVDALRAALVVYDEALRTIGQARVKLAQMLLRAEGQQIPEEPVAGWVRFDGDMTFVGISAGDFAREAALQAEPGRMIHDAESGISSMTTPPWETVPCVPFVPDDGKRFDVTLDLIDDDDGPASRA